MKIPKSQSRSKFPPNSAIGGMSGGFDNPYCTRKIPENFTCLNESIALSIRRIMGIES